MRDTRTSIQVLPFSPKEWVVVGLGNQMGVKLAIYTNEQEAVACAQRIEEALAA